MEHRVTLPTINRLVDADFLHFRAALDLLDQDWGGSPGQAQGEWGAMVKRMKEADAPWSSVTRSSPPRRPTRSLEP